MPRVWLSMQVKKFLFLGDRLNALKIVVLLRLDFYVYSWSRGTPYFWVDVDRFSDYRNINNRNGTIRNQGTKRDGLQVYSMKILIVYGLPVPPAPIGIL